MNCRSLKVVNTILEAGEAFTFQIEPRGLAPRCSYELCVNMDWGEATGAEKVYINDGTDTYQVFDCIADRLTVAQIRTCCNCNRVVLRMVFGADVTTDDYAGHFQLRYPTIPNGNCVPTFVATAAAAAAAG